LYIYDGTEWVAFNKETIKEQSKEVAGYMFTQIQESEHDTRLEAAKNLLAKEPLMTDEDLDRVMSPSYLLGDIECRFTEDEVAFLNECLDTIQEYHCSLQYDASETNDVALFESIEKKITELYEDHCVKYGLSPAMKAYHAKYGTFGNEDAYDLGRWDGFREAFVMNAEVAK
jgi:hypothetical protein